MQVSRKLIENVGELKKALNEISVYDFDVYTSMELYYKIANKLNEVIKELMRFEGLVSDEVIKQNEKLIYLLGEGLNIEVVKKINQMVADGTMDTIINHNVFNSLNNKVENYKEELSSQIKENVDKLSGVINIEQYKHLVNNGDWTNALQQAINDISSNQELIITGDIILKDAVYLKSNLTIKGNNGINSYDNNVNINFTDNGCIKTPENLHLYNININNIVFKYEGINPTSNIIACQRLKVDNCTFIGFDCGLKLTTKLSNEEQSDNNIVENKILDCSFYSNNYGFVCEGNGYGHVTDGFLSKCIFARNKIQDASLNSNSGGWDINGCHFYSQGLSDYSLQISNMLNTVSNCYFESSKLQLKLNLNSSLGINIISNNKFMQGLDDSISIEIIATQEQRSLTIVNNEFRWVGSTTATNVIGVKADNNGANIYPVCQNNFYGYSVKYNFFNSYHPKIIDFNDDFFGINTNEIKLLTQNDKISIKSNYGVPSTVNNVGSILIDYKNAGFYISKGGKWHRVDKQNCISKMTSSSDVDKYIKIAEIKLSNQYDTVYLKCTVNSLGSNFKKSNIDLFVRQEQTLGNRPIINLSLSDSIGFTEENFNVEITNNTIELTTVELRVKVTDAYHFINTLNIETTELSNNTNITIFNNQSAI